MMKLILTARSKTDNTTDYSPLDKHGLQSTIKHQGGNGSSDNPFKIQMQISNLNESIWSGVIHIELPFTKQEPRYFLPAFMYGKNRGGRKMFLFDFQDLEKVPQLYLHLPIG